MAKLANNGENLNKTSGGGAARRRILSLVKPHCGSPRRRKAKTRNDCKHLHAAASRKFFLREHVRKSLMKRIFN